MKNKKGFTLIELMIVVCILFILAAIIIPQVYQSKHKKGDGCSDELVQTISNITKVDIINNNTVVIHTAEALYTYTPVDFQKGTKINYSRTNVYHRKNSTYCIEAYYFGQGD